MDAFLRKIRNFCEEESLLPRGTGVIIGISGGADSVCLARFLADVRGDLDLKLYAVHVHHGIRGEEADRDAEFVREVCAELEIPCEVLSYDIPAMAAEQGQTLEEMGRTVRYRAFEEERIRRGADVIAVAHHRDDSAETILMQMFRGTGLRGLCGIAPRNGAVIRPLLCVSREEIEAWMSGNGYSYRTDSTNLRTDAVRNRVRLELLPYIKEYIQPAAEEVLLANASHLRDAEEYLREQAERAWPEVALRVTAERIELSGEHFRGQAPVIQEYILRHAFLVLSGSAKDWGHVQVEQCRDLFEKQTGRRIDLPMGLQAVRTYEGVRIGRAESGRTSAETGEGNLEIREISREEMAEFQPKDCTEFIDYDKIINCLLLRTRSPGDRIAVFRDGRHKKLQDFFVDRKVPEEERDRIALVADGSEIVWIPGYRVSGRYRVTAETKRILAVTYPGVQPDAGTGSEGAGRR